VCTEMKTPMPNTVVVYRNARNVSHTGSNSILLTKSDLKIKTEFVCNINSKYWGGLKMLSSMIAIAALAVAVVATGGAVLVVAAVVAASATAVAIGSQAAEIFHNCDVTTTSKWIGFHSSVNFNGSNALLQSSNLICGKGGALSLVIDPVLAAKAGEKLALNNSKEYQAHLNSQSIQGVILALSSGGKPEALLVGYVFAVSSYVTGEKTKQEARSNQIEDVVRGKAEYEKASIFTASLDGVQNSAKGTFRDTAIEATHNPKIVSALANNGAIIANYPSVITASVGSAYPMASLRLNSSLYLAAARKSFDPTTLKTLGQGFAWGVAGAAVDIGMDEYEETLYEDTLKYFIDSVIKKNKNAQGINVKANES
jgi:hypothetical protein